MLPVVTFEAVPSPARRGAAGRAGLLEDLLCPDGTEARIGKAKKFMWQAFKNVETGVIHAVKVPGGRTPHGFAFDWPLVETAAPLTCHLCLRYAYAHRRQAPALEAMLPVEMRAIE